MRGGEQGCAREPLLPCTSHAVWQPRSVAATTQQPRSVAAATQCGSARAHAQAAGAQQGPCAGGSERVGSILTELDSPCADGPMAMWWGVSTCRSLGGVHRPPTCPATAAPGLARSFPQHLCLLRARGLACAGTLQATHASGTYAALQRPARAVAPHTALTLLRLPVSTGSVSGRAAVCAALVDAACRECSRRVMSRGCAMLMDAAAGKQGLRLGHGRCSRGAGAGAQQARGPGSTAGTCARAGAALCPHTLQPGSRCTGQEAQPELVQEQALCRAVEDAAGGRRWCLLLAHRTSPKHVTLAILAGIVHPNSQGGAPRASRTPCLQCAPVLLVISQSCDPISSDSVEAGMGVSPLLRCMGAQARVQLLALHRQVSCHGQLRLCRSALCSVFWSIWQEHVEAALA